MTSSRILIGSLCLAWLLIVGAAIADNVRFVPAEDSCAENTFAVGRTPFGLTCIGEP